MALSLGKSRHKMYFPRLSWDYRVESETQITDWLRGERTLNPSHFCSFVSWMPCLIEQLIHPNCSESKRLDLFTTLLLLLMRRCVGVFGGLMIYHSYSPVVSFLCLVHIISHQGPSLGFSWHFISLSITQSTIFPTYGSLEIFSSNGFNMSQLIKFKTTLERRFPSKVSVCY